MIRQGERIYNFTIGDFDPSIFPIPKELEDAIVEAYRKHFTNYPAAEGNLDLREAIHSFIKDEEGLDYGINEILVASGGRPLIYTVFRAICDKGDKIIYAVPSWNNNHYTHFVEGEHIVIEAKAENNFMPTADDIRPYVKEASLISLCSPQNPTGTTFRKEELEAICDTGGTLAKSAGLLKEKGARTVRALITHPVLSGKAYENIENSVLEELIVCDTIPVKKESQKIKVLSVAELFAVAIRNAYENKSITSLFIHSQRRDK